MLPDVNPPPAVRATPRVVLPGSVLTTFVNAIKSVYAPRVKILALVLMETVMLVLALAGRVPLVAERVTKLLDLLAPQVSEALEEPLVSVCTVLAGLNGPPTGPID